MIKSGHDSDFGRRLGETSLTVEVSLNNTITFVSWQGKHIGKCSSRNAINAIPVRLTLSSISVAAFAEVREHRNNFQSVNLTKLQQI